jgi:HK97 family phage prohead protease
MIYSSLTKNTRDVDTKKGIVSFYFADFNSVDAHGRRMHKNAFNRTFNNNFKRMVHLFNHDQNIIIGKPLEVGTDQNGAFMVSKLSNTDKGREVLTLYEENILNEHSFGFIIKNSTQEDKVEVVNELQMYEASTVTWGANPNTPVIALNDLSAKVLELEKMHETQKDILLKIDAIMARLPAEQHQAPQTSEDELINFINNY